MTAELRQALTDWLQHDPGTNELTEAECNLVDAAEAWLAAPTRDLTSAAGQPLNPDQVHQWPDHAGFTDEDARP